MIIDLSRRPRRGWLLCRMFEYSPTTLHVRAHRTAVGAALIAETAEGVSYPATIRPLLGLGLIEVGELIDMDWPASDTDTAYHRSARPLILTAAGYARAEELTRTGVRF